MKHRNISRSLRLCVWTLVLSGVVYGQNAPGKGPQATPSQTPNPSQRGTAGQTPTTAQPGGTQSTASSPSISTSNSFVSKALEINSAEIQLGQLAAKKSQNDKV